MRRALLPLALALAAASTACQGTEEAPPAPPTATVAADQPAAEESTAAETPPDASSVDPCSLVSKEEAEKVAGLPLEDAVAAPSACSYTAPPSGPVGQVEVYVGDGAKKQLDIEKQLGHELTPISGAGDEAYIYAEGMTVFVSKGGIWTSIRLVRIDEPAKFRKGLEDLARTMSTRY
ncbi:DUF3558 family protein [Phytohabitans kaempferiae]|uniref:DUF3558 family protein n=1 Tax=Phytohabitans kaempferiae TaxID=1620943 RepID=A0ABV6M2Q8_9ACTN